MFITCIECCCFFVCHQVLSYCYSYVLMYLCSYVHSYVGWVLLILAIVSNIFYFPFLHSLENMKYIIVHLCICIGARYFKCKYNFMIAYMLYITSLSCSPSSFKYMIQGLKVCIELFLLMVLYVHVHIVLKNYIIVYYVLEA